MSIATLDAVDTVRAYLEIDAVLGLEADLDASDRLRALVGFGDDARIWSPVAGLYDAPSAGLVPWTNQAAAIVYEVTNEEPQADNGSIAVQVAFLCYGGPDDEFPDAVSYRQARKVARALRARLHNISGGSAGVRSIMRSDQNLASQAAVDEDGFPFVLSGYGLTIQ